MATLLQSSSSEDDPRHQATDQRKRKRMISNRESARRSRMRKQKHLDDLMGQVEELKKDNDQIRSETQSTDQMFMKMEAENSVLRAQMEELSQRLQSLGEISDFLNNAGTSGLPQSQNHHHHHHHHPHHHPHHMDHEDSTFMTMNSWNPLYMNQPIMASAEMFMH